MSRIYVFWIWYPQSHVDAQGNGRFSLNDFFMCSNPLMEVPLGFLLQLTHGGFLQALIFHWTVLYSFSMNLFMEVLVKWLYAVSCRYYTTLLGFLWIDVIPLDGFVCKNIISFLKWDQEKNIGVGHIHMIQDNKGLVCPSTYLIHGSFLIFMVNNHYFLGISYLLTIQMFLIPIFPKQKIRVSKNVFSITFSASLYGSPSMFFMF